MSHHNYSETSVFFTVIYILTHQISYYPNSYPETSVLQLSRSHILTILKYNYSCHMAIQIPCYNYYETSIFQALQLPYYSYSAMA